MPSFREILTLHGPILLLDAASARVQVGWLEANRTPAWSESTDEAGVGLFRSLEALDVKPNEAGAFIFCSGPGSVLGVRTSAMAVRAWNALRPRPTFSYHGLAVVAHALHRPELTIVADARRESWHAYRIGEPLRRVPTAELKGKLATPEGFRAWSVLPDGVERVPYSMADLLPPMLDQPGLLIAEDSPDAFLHEAPSYATWTPQVHRAPGSGNVS